MTSFKIKSLLLVVAAIAVGMLLLTRPVSRPASAQIPLPGAPPGRSLLNQKLVWAHCMVSYPLDLDLLYHYKPQGYAEMYPLYQEQGLMQRTGLPWQATDIEAAKAAGVDGFALDIFTNAQDAAPSLEAADRLGGFLIAPCIDTSTASNKVGDAFRAVDQYCHLAASHPSAARVDGKFLIFTYGTEQIKPGDWQWVRNRLLQAGDSTYWIAAVDLGTSAQQANGFPESTVTQYSDLFEGGYIFGPSGSYFSNLVTLFGSEHKPFIGGMMPGYYRAGAGNWDSNGTGQYRYQWQKHLDSGVPWVTITTWNDFQEDTDITPSSDWSFTRANLTRWYSAKFKGLPEPWTRPQLYISTPKTVYPNQTARAEALVLNPLKHAVTASVQFYDAGKQPVGEPVSATIPAETAETATKLLPMSAFHAGSFLRAHARIEEGGRPVVSVVSPPVLVLDPEAQPGYPVVYYSVPADHVLPDPVTLVSENGELTYRYPARVQRRFAEVLHNTALMKNSMRGRTISLRLPAQPDYGSPVQVTSWGFDLARVTDDQFRVGYSDPIYIPPPSSLSLKEKYDFDEGSGNEIKDQSPFHQNSKLIDVGWTQPGYHNSPACVYFNGHSSRINMTVGQTPAGPVSWKLAVRPSAYGGVLYADIGGFIVSLGKDGKVQYSRHTHTQFVTAYGGTPLPVGQWSVVQCTWDGTTSRIFVNGKLDGQTACPPGFGSSQRALGCNPFGSSSDYYNGDMDDFELSTEISK